MTKIEQFKGYEDATPTSKPTERVLPNVVTVQQGVPVKYGTCDGVGVRVVHPSNPHARSENLSLVMFYLPPHAVLKPGSHQTEECYVILRGSGTMTLAGEEVQVSAGTFVHLPSWCEHGVANTGPEMMEIMICTSPPNP